MVPLLPAAAAAAEAPTKGLPCGWINGKQFPGPTLSHSLWTSTAAQGNKKAKGKKEKKNRDENVFTCAQCLIADADTSKFWISLYKTNGKV
jgi:ABC-type glycerol-3-phosphate transport system substrate-binding protein